MIPKSLAFLAVAAALAALSVGASAASMQGLKLNNAPTKLGPGGGPPRYVFTVSSFTITKTRALHQDTDYVVAGLTGQPNQVKAMGDLNNGTYQAGVSLTAGVPDGSSQTFTYYIINSSDPLSAVNSFLREAALDVGQNFGLNLTGILPGGCDGIVAKGRHTLTAADLAAGTAGGRVIEATDMTNGTDSATGCGSNSRYSVRWTVAAAP